MKFSTVLAIIITVAAAVALSMLYQPASAPTPGRTLRPVTGDELPVPTNGEVNIY